MTSAPASSLSSFALPAPMAEAMARSIWGDASGNVTFDAFGEERTCGWGDDEPCVQHPTFLGGSAEAYGACDDAMARAFGDPRLTRDVERYILFNSDANIPMGNCSSLLSASEGRGGTVASAREGFLERWPDGAHSASVLSLRPSTPALAPTPSSEGYFCAEKTYTQNFNVILDFGGCDILCPSTSPEECPGEGEACARSEHCDRLSPGDGAPDAAGAPSPADQSGPLTPRPAPDELDDSTGGAWSYIPATLPAPLSDMSIAPLAAGGDGEGLGLGREPRGVMITGGCDSPNGNEYVDTMGYFECSSLSAKAYAFVPTRETPSHSWSGQFNALAGMPRARYRHASVAVSGKVCVFGGRDANDLLIDDIDCYDPLSDAWSTPATIPEEYVASDLAAFVVEGDLVNLVGGFDGIYNALDRVGIVDMSDLDDISFSDGPKLNVKRGDIDAAVAENGDVYVAGGYTHENLYAAPISSVERYNAATRSWGGVAPLNKERGDLRMAAAKGKVYAIGGEKTKPGLSKIDAMPGERFQVLDSVELLEIDDGRAEWKNSSSMPRPLSRFVAHGWGVEEEEKSFIFIFGGQTTYDSSCKCFPSTDRVIVFEQNDEDEKSSSETPDIISSPSLRPSTLPSRAVAGTTGPSGTAFGVNVDGEGTPAGASTLENHASNVTSPGPSTPSTQPMAGSTGSLPSSAPPTALATSATSSLAKDLIDEGGPPLIPSLMPSASPSATHDKDQSATPTIDVELSLETSRGWLMSSSGYTPMLILLVALNLFLF